MATRTDAGYKLTDVELAKLEGRISEVYSEAAKDLKKTSDRYFERFEDQDYEMYQKAESGEISQSEYMQWRTNTFARGEKYQTMARNMAERATNANTVAAQYINEAMSSVYALNRNYTAYALDYAMQGGRTEFDTGDQYSGNIDWDLMDENTVRRLIVEQPETMPNYPAQRAINRGIDLAYGQKRIGETITSGIIRGVSVRKMASELTNTITTMSKTSAIRAARTACTSAQNGGRQDMLNYAVDTLGIKANKMWIATKDERTRDSHRELDGVQVEYNKKFPNKLKYPGDSTGAPEEVYNCRCCLGYVLPETEDDFNGDGQYATGNTVESYQEWLADQWAAKSGGGWGGFRRTSGSENRMASAQSGWPDCEPINHTKEEQQDIIDFGEARGIKVSCVDKFTGDTELLKEQIEKIADIKSRYGIKAKIGVSFDNLGAGTVAWTPNSVIIFNNDILRNRELTEAYLNNDGTLASKSITGIASHEAMHIFEKENGIHGIDIAIQAYYNIHGENIDYNGILKELRKNVSTYSAISSRGENKYKSSYFGEITPEVVALHETGETDFTREFVRLLIERKKK